MGTRFISYVKKDSHIVFCVSAVKIVFRCPKNTHSFYLRHPSRNYKLYHKKRHKSQGEMLFSKILIRNETEKLAK